MSKEQDGFSQFISCARAFSNFYEYPITGERKWVITQGRGWPKDLPDGNYVYVVLPDTAEIRFSEKPRPHSEIHHPELCDGEDVIGAGFFRLYKGKIVFLSNESGHYAPDGWSMRYVRRAFEHWGLPLADELEIDTRWEVFANN